MRLKKREGVMNKRLQAICNPRLDTTDVTLTVGELAFAILARPYSSKANGTAMRWGKADTARARAERGSNLLVYPIFRRVGDFIVPVLIHDSNGVLRAPDGHTFLSLDQAAAQ